MFHGKKEAGLAIPPGGYRMSVMSGETGREAVVRPAIFGVMWTDSLPRPWWTGSSPCVSWRRISFGAGSFRTRRIVPEDRVRDRVRPLSHDPTGTDGAGRAIAFERSFFAPHRRGQRWPESLRAGPCPI